MAHADSQLPLDTSLQEFHSIQTPNGVSTTWQIIQGGADAGNYLQSVTQHYVKVRVQNWFE